MQVIVDIASLNDDLWPC